MVTANRRSVCKIHRYGYENVLARWCVASFVWCNKMALSANITLRRYISCLPVSLSSPSLRFAMVFLFLFILLWCAVRHKRYDIIFEGKIQRNTLDCDTKISVRISAFAFRLSSLCTCNVFHFLVPLYRCLPFSIAVRCVYILCMVNTTSNIALRICIVMIIWIIATWI